MKPFFVVCSMLLSAGVACADPSPALDLRRASEDAEAGRHVRDAGIVSAVVGTALGAAGVGLLVHQIRSGNVDDGVLQGPAALLAVGLGGVAAGLPMWGVGQARVNKAEAARIGPTASGLRVTF